MYMLYLIFIIYTNIPPHGGQIPPPPSQSPPDAYAGLGDICLEGETQNKFICNPHMNLTCIDGVCDCKSGFMPNENCECHSNYRKYGESCRNDDDESVIAFTSCDAELNLYCDNGICLCLPNYISSGVGCIPGNGVYGDECDIEYETEITQNLDNTKRKKKRSIPFDDKEFEGLISSPEFKKWETNVSKTTTTTTTISALGKSGNEDNNTDNFLFSRHPIRCNPNNITFKITITTTPDIPIILQNKLNQKKNGCNPSLNLRCMEGICICSKKHERESEFGNGCKLSKLLSCKDDNDCYSGSCVEFKGKHGIDETFCSTAHNILYSIILIYICIIFIIYIN